MPGSGKSRTGRVLCASADEARANEANSSATQAFILSLSCERHKRPCQALSWRGERRRVRTRSKYTCARASLHRFEPARNGAKENCHTILTFAGPEGIVLSR